MVAANVDALSLLTALPESFESRFARLLASSLKTKFPIDLAGLSDGTLTSEVQSVLRAILPTSITLLKSRPDFESTMVHLMSEVERTGAWLDSDISATGQMILRLIATDIDYGQFAIARALQEAYPESARSDNSVYLASRMLGNRLVRNVSAQVSVDLTRGDPGTFLELPAYTAFQLENSQPFFCRDPIRFTEDDITVNVKMYQGKLKRTSVNSTGQPMQTIEVGSETYQIGENDVRVSVAGVPWQRVNDPIWHYGPEDKVFYESMLPNGNVEIVFGTGLMGAAPQSGVPILVEWVECLGTAANRPEVGLRMDLDALTADLGSLTGLTTTPVSLGVDRLPAVFHRRYGGMRRAAQRRAVRRGDYRSHALSYAGVKDARFRGQAELGPKKPSWQNIIGVTLLTDPVFTEQQWTEFVAYMTELGIYQCDFLRIDPPVIEYDMTIDVYCRGEANLAEVERELTRQIREATAPGNDSLGYSWYMSDLNDLAEGTGALKTLIEYAVIATPTEPLLCANGFEWVKLNELTINMHYTRRGGYEGRLDQVVPGALPPGSNIV